MKSIITSLPDQMPSLHPLPAAMPKDINYRQLPKVDYKEAFVASSHPSTIVDDPSGWDESWFANYE